MSKSTVPGAVFAAVVLAALTVSCGTTDRNDTNDTTAKAGTAAPAATTAPADTAPPTGAETAAPPADAGGTGTPAPFPDSGETAPEKVRDAFAGLQATLNESCDVPADCPEFLGRVHEELQSMDRAMKADPKGPGHFPEPIALIQELNGELGGDRSFENLKKHQAMLVGTRDRINTWMQDHPDDYR
ncbi:hypothetical protein [Streptomyces wedmorensis]